MEHNVAQGYKIDWFTCIKSTEYLHNHIGGGKGGYGAEALQSTKGAKPL